MDYSKIKSSRRPGTRCCKSTRIAALVAVVAAGASGGLAACSGSSTSNAISTPSKAAPSKTANWDSFRSSSQKVAVEVNELNSGSLATAADCKTFVSVVGDLKSLPDSPNAALNTALDKFAADMKVIADDCVPLINGTATQQQIARAQAALKAGEVDNQQVIAALKQANAPADIQRLWAG